jgi:hypothetical protein
VTGAHSFQPPGAGDFRGPCPGLNALANHKFIPHNGIVTFNEAIAQTIEGTDFVLSISILIHYAFSIRVWGRFCSRRSSSRALRS